MGEKIQWAQMPSEDCFQGRRLPSNVLPSKWTCSSNSWNPERSCSATRELTAEQLENLLPQCNPAAYKKMKATKTEPENVDALEGLDTLANLAIFGEGEALPASSKATTKHPGIDLAAHVLYAFNPQVGKAPNISRHVLVMFAKQ